MEKTWEASRTSSLSQEAATLNMPCWIFGGFAGIGDTYFAVPWRALQVDQDTKRLALDLQKKDLKDAPGF